MIKEKQETSEEKVEEQEQKESYHIFEYVKEHTGFAVACISGGIAVASSIISILSLAYQHIVLQVWNISTWDLIPTFKGTLYFSFALGFIYVVILCCTPSAAELWFAQYYRKKAMLLYGRAANKHLEMRLKSAKKAIKNLRKKIQKLKKKKSTEEVEVEELSSEVENIDIEICATAKKIKNNKRKVWRACKTLFFYMFFMLLSIALLIFLVLFIFQAITEEISWSVLLVLGISVIEIVLPASSIVKVMEPDIAPKTVKTIIQSKMGSGGECVSELLKRGEELINKSENKPTKKVLVSDRMLKSFGKSLLTGLVTLIVAVITTAIINKGVQDTVWLYVTPEKSYAVAYQTSDLCILKEAIIDGDRLLINTAEQLVVTGSIETKRQTFSKLTFVSD